MKRRLIVFSAAIAVAVTMFIGCKKTTEAAASQNLSEKISSDVAFKNTIESAVNLYSSTSGGSLNDKASLATLQTIIAKVNDKTATTADYAKAAKILGMPYDDFIKALQNFGLSLNDLCKKYPELSKMNSTDLQKTFTDAIKLNSELQNSLGNTMVLNGRVTACPLRDICNLAVTLASLFGGSALCTAINVSTIPVVGGLLCTLILKVGTTVLTAICNGLPC